MGASETACWVSWGAGALAMALAACDTAAPPTSATLPATTFTDLFVRVDSIPLEQPPDYPLVTIVGLDVAPDGRLAVADAGDARVSLYSSSGELLTSIGRRGDGPGEFRFPRAPVFDETGRVHVVDPLLHRVSIFSETGELLGDFATPRTFVIQDVSLSPRGYFVTGQDGPDRGVVMEIDSLGNPLWQDLRIAGLRPRGERETPRWQTLRSQALVPVGDTLFITHTLFDSVWALDARTGTVFGSRGITVEGYEPPWMPEEEVGRDPSGIAAWATQQMRATTIEGDGVLLVVPFAKGAYWVDARASLAAIRGPDGSWSTVRDTPTTLRVKSNRVYTLERPTLEDVVIGVYEWRGT